jgi:NAD(P)-dependent dehydrogenase (short-subunit alcohol dehydrogenase family)
MYQFMYRFGCRSAGSLIERISARAGPVSILVNNAGVHLKKLFLETSEQELLDVLLSSAGRVRAELC